MGSVSDRSNPRYFLPLGLLLSCAVMMASGLVKAIYASLALVVALQAINGWVQGMGWPPCGKTMVHWFSTRERGPRGLDLERGAQRRRRAGRATFAALGVMLFGDWGAKFYFNAAIAAVVAVVAFVLLRRHAAVARPAADRGVQERLPAGLRRRQTSGRSVPGDLRRARAQQPRPVGDCDRRTRSSTSSATAS